MEVKFVTWNVNGFRAALKNGFAEKFDALQADIFCIQETKMQPGQADFAPRGYYQYFHSAVKPGYSGTAVFSRTEPLQVTYGLNGAHADEGRVITLDYGTFSLVNCYTPNAQRGLVRIDYRLEFEDAMRAYLCDLQEKDPQKPIIVCGDLNVAANDIDLKNPAANRGNAGFSDEERGKFQQLLQAGFTDVFRMKFPDLAGAYTWWSYMFHAREKNTGWRIDYFLLSSNAVDSVKEISLHPELMGSDHCPVEMTLDL